MTVKRINLLILMILFIWISGCEEKHTPPSSAASKQYELSVTGTSDVQLEMLCVYKSAENPGSVKRIQKQISVPYNENISAYQCYVWIDTLPEGASGNEGDEYFIELKRDGQTITTCGPTKIKKANRKTYSLGDL